NSKIKTSSRSSRSRINSNSKTRSRISSNSGINRISSSNRKIDSHKTNRAATNSRRRKSKTTRLRRRTSHKRNSSNTPARALLRRQARKSSRPTSLHRRLGNAKLKNHRPQGKEKMSLPRREKERAKLRHHLLLREN